MTKVTRLTLDDEGGLNRRRIHLREISGDLDAPLETVGQDLRAARLRRGDDLATVSRALKIRKDHLEALEEDRIEVLPGRAYAIGFVRSYADYLGLDAVQCVERLKAEIAGRTAEETVTPVVIFDEDEQRRLPHGWIIIAGVVLMLAIWGFYYLAQSADRMLGDSVIAPPPQMTLKTAVAPHKPAPAHPVTALPQASTPVAPASQAKPATSGNAAPSQPPSAPAVQPQPLPQGQVYGLQNKNARVVLLVLRTTRVLVEGPDSKLFINRTLMPGDSYRVPNFVGMVLTTPDAGAVELNLDGLAMGLAGKNAETVEALSLDPQAIMDRHGSRSGR